MLRIGLLASGNLGLHTARGLAANYDVRCILTDKGSIGLIDLANSIDVPVFIGNPRKGKAYTFIKEIKLDVIISINYLYLIEADIISHPSLLSFNLHGSLLPKYRGRTPHVWAIINNEKSTGITAHVIDIGCDSGDIIDQIEISIAFEDTGNDVLLKFHQAYYPLVKKVLTQLMDGTIQYRTQDHRLATYYGKRSPSDGHINWSWQKQRIYNFIRAQSSPYPGAFFFYETEKIMVHKSHFSDLGYNYKSENGTIIKIANDSLHIKTPNGCLQLFELEYQNFPKFTVGSIVS